MSRRHIYFATDAHLGNRYAADPRAAEKKLVRWLDTIKADAAAIYFLGDMFDYWYEYRYVVPRGHVRFLGKLAELTDAGIDIHLFIGNHDIWMFDYLPTETGVRVHQGPMTVDLLGRRFFLAHGDEVGRHKPMFRFLQAMFRNRLCQLLYASLHPRWTFGFARNWSLSSRKSGMERAESDDEKAAYLVDFAEAYVQTHPDIDFFIFGHRHILFDRPVDGSRARMLIAGDWMRHFSYVCWDGRQLELKQYDDA